MSTTKGVWKLQEVRNQILADDWQVYDRAADTDPGGTLWAWGSNAGGQLGNSDTITRSSPIQIPGTAWLPTTGGGLAGINTGYNFFLKTDNTLWFSGGGLCGVSGTNISDNRPSSPIQIPGTAWCRVVANSYGALALKTNNTLWAWGHNCYGNLGTNNTIFRSSPIQIAGTAWCAIGINGTTDGTYANSFIASHAIKTDGTLWGWGYNELGGIGNNSVINRSSPVQIPGTQWTEVAGTGDASGAIARKTDGTLWSWGSDYGLHGGSSSGIQTISSPVQIPGQWVSISNGGHKMAIKTDRSLWSWGCNFSGQLGDGTVTTRSSPIQIPGCWSKVAAGYFFTVAAKADGTLWSWGSNSGGALGTNNATTSSSPIQIPGTNWFCPSVSLNGNNYFAFARKFN